MNSQPFKIGHVHLKVLDLDRSLVFYTRVLGLKVKERVNSYLFLTYGNEHHDIALHEVGEGAKVPDLKDVGLYHVAFEASSRVELKKLYQRIKDAGIDVRLVDHSISKVLYFTDPDGNGFEAYIDTRKETGSEKWKGQSTTFDISSL